MLEIKIQLNEVATGKHLITPLFLSLADVLSWCLKKEEEEAWSRKKSVSLEQIRVRERARRLLEHQSWPGTNDLPSKHGYDPSLWTRAVGACSENHRWDDNEDHIQNRTGLSLSHSLSCSLSLFLWVYVSLSEHSMHTWHSQITQLLNIVLRTESCIFSTELQSREEAMAAPVFEISNAMNNKSSSKHAN